MSRRRKILTLLIVFLAALLLFIALDNPFPQNPNNNEGIPPANGNPDSQKVPKLVVPENPFGILGAIAAFAAALGTFGLLKKKK